MTIDKVKYDPKNGKVTVHWHEGDGEDPQHVFTLVSTDPPAPAFLDALRALRPDVETLCEVALACDSLTVRGVTVGRSDDGLAASITGCYETARGVLVLNTPYGSVTGPTRERIEALTEQARAYVGGLRAQGSLFGEGASPVRRAMNIVGRRAHATPRTC